MILRAGKPVYLSDAQSRVVSIMGQGNQLLSIHGRICVDADGFEAGSAQSVRALIRLGLVEFRSADGREAYALSPKGREAYSVIAASGGKYPRPTRGKDLCDGCGCTKGRCLCSPGV